METENVKRKGFNGRISIVTRLLGCLSSWVYVVFNSVEPNNPVNSFEPNKGGGSHFIIKDI